MKAEKDPGLRIPIPPLEMRMLVGSTEESAFDNPNGKCIFPDLPEGAWDFVLDFGCGCGRLARQLLLQRPTPRCYVGIDLHRGMIRWCQQNLEPLHPGFRFIHHDCYHAGFNPEGRVEPLPFPVPDESTSLVVAWSVFTHLIQDHVEFYLREICRVLRCDGVAVTTWFLFDKRFFPMMQPFQNALYINLQDPTNAVIFDREWLRSLFRSVGLVPVRVQPPYIRGFQWLIYLRRREPGVPEEDFPEDQAPFGTLPPPICSGAPHKLGL